MVGAAIGTGALLSMNSVQANERRPGPGSSAVGTRADTESVERLPFGGVVSFTPLHELHGTITPSDLHFERHHGGIPRLDPTQHELVIHGMVAQPLKFTLGDLKRFPSVTRTCFIECSGNYVTRFGNQSTPQITCGLTSQSEWTGVPLATLLHQAGVKDKATWLLAEGGDAPLLSRSIPMAKALDDALVVYAQNGEAIRPEQGYPFRLLLPGWEGNTSVKWLRRIAVSDAPFMTREETSKYTDKLADGNYRQFSFTMDARSIITYPTYPATIEPGMHEIRGLAWSGRGRIIAVEVSTNGGQSWQKATLQGPVLDKAHTRFNLPWRWNGKATEIQSRAIDETGYVQPTLKQLQAVRATTSTNYHFNPIVGWHIKADGSIEMTETG
mgnify:CR=1 FL=1